MQVRISTYTFGEATNSVHSIVYYMLGTGEVVVKKTGRFLPLQTFIQCVRWTEKTLMSISKKRKQDKRLERVLKQGSQGTPFQ